MKIQIVDGDYSDETLTFNKNVYRQSELMNNFKRKNLRPVTGFEHKQSLMTGHLSHKMLVLKKNNPTQN